jgi:hypothetical protein
MADDVGLDRRNLDLVIFADQPFGRAPPETPATLFAGVRPVIAKFTGIFRECKVVRLISRLGPPGLDPSRLAFLSVDGGFDESHEFFSGRCSRRTSRSIAPY